MAIPEFLIKRTPKQRNIRKIRNFINDCKLHTVCESARCPNIGECFSKKSLTFIILGNICTRSCRFCGVDKGVPHTPDPDEPERIAQAAKKLELDYVVMTSVTRDDLSDGGADHFASVINAVHSQLPAVRVEVLIPDFQGSQKALKTVLEAKPFVLNHNVETVPRLYPSVRPQANYERSLEVLRKTKELNSAPERHRVYTKSGFMVGLGEVKEEVFNVLKDLKTGGSDMVTIGQYLPPSGSHPKAERYVHPEEFEEYRAFGKEIGLFRVFAGPFVRSSYRAKNIMESQLSAQRP